MDVISGHRMTFVCHEPVQDERVAFDTPLATYHLTALAWMSRPLVFLSLELNLRSRRGVLQSKLINVNQNGTLFNSSADLFFGTANSGAAGRCWSSMDEFQIYNRKTVSIRNHCFSFRSRTCVRVVHCFRTDRARDSTTQSCPTRLHVLSVSTIDLSNLTKLSVA